MVTKQINWQQTAGSLSEQVLQTQLTQDVDTMLGQRQKTLAQHRLDGL